LFSSRHWFGFGFRKMDGDTVGEVSADSWPEWMKLEDWMEAVGWFKLRPRSAG
jgi:hypothetical protein